MSIESSIITSTLALIGGTAPANVQPEKIQFQEETPLQDTIKQMTKAEIRKLFYQIISEKLGIKTSAITDDKEYTDDLGADSLDVVELVMEFEKRFNVAISDELFENIKTVGQTINAIYELLNNGIVLYSKPNFEGNSKSFTANYSPNSSIMSTIIEDGLSSMIVPKGYSIVLSDSKGANITINALENGISINDFSKLRESRFIVPSNNSINWDNKIVSLKIVKSKTPSETNEVNASNFKSPDGKDLNLDNIAKYKSQLPSYDKIREKVFQKISENKHISPLALSNSTNYTAIGISPLELRAFNLSFEQDFGIELDNTTSNNFQNIGQTIDAINDNLHNGVVLFSHPDFGGYSKSFTANYNPSGSMAMVINHGGLSSIFIPRGYRITLYAERDYTGAFIEINAEDREVKMSNFVNLIPNPSIYISDKNMNWDKSIVSMKVRIKKTSDNANNNNNSTSIKPKKSMDKYFIPFSDKTFSKDETRKKVIKMVSEKREVDISKIEDKTKYKELWTDPVDKIELMLELEEEFNINIDDKTASKLETIGQTVNVVYDLTNVTARAGTFKDSRDGKFYKTLQIGHQTWFAENLAYNVRGNCLLYDYNSKNIAEYGYLYNLPGAMRACPPGWHIPSKAEWDILFEQYGEEGGVSFFEHLKNGGDAGFNAMPGGWFGIGLDKFLFKGAAGYYWTSSADDDRIFYCYFDFNNEITFFNSNIPECPYSVRCVKD